ncbi:MAG: hypothetical protein AABP62_29170, partial [Planctomycetota bacterium]
VAPPTGDAVPTTPQVNRRRNSIGAPVVVSQIVIAATESSLLARDVLTGGLLWNVSLEQQPRGGPVVDGLNVLLPGDGQIAVYNVVDGVFVRRRPMGEHAAVHWHIPEEAGRPVTPRVSLQGRVYFATERGAIVCLGAEQP